METLGVTLHIEIYVHVAYVIHYASKSRSPFRMSMMKRTQKEVSPFMGEDHRANLGDGHTGHRGFIFVLYRGWSYPYVMKP